MLLRDWIAFFHKTVNMHCTVLTKVAAEHVCKLANTLYHCIFVLCVFSNPIQFNQFNSVICF